MQHIHILGIGGTFMGSLAQLAQAKGYKVTGCDRQVYPPMSTQLEQAGIELIEGFDADQLKLKPDLYVIGNVVTRGNPLMEAILNRNLPYVSGPAWLASQILLDKWVLAVAGTHGKTTTSSLLAWILEFAGFEPGYLIGGVPNNFATSASLGKSDFFVIEADEYDSAFFDKRSKFLHYRPRTLILNNLEFDHADIFPDLQAIQTQFHHLVRTVPGEGLIIYPQKDDAINQVLARGCWTPTQSVDHEWHAEKLNSDASQFSLYCKDKKISEIQWALSGDHNLLNATAAVMAAKHIGVDPLVACAALTQFKNVKRRMELKGEIHGIQVFDDFAHHPTAIRATLKAARERFPNRKITAVIELRSNTMKLGVHNHLLKAACDDANQVYWCLPMTTNGAFENTTGASYVRHFMSTQVDDIVNQLVAQADAGECILVMSNGSFEGIHEKILLGLAQRHA